MKNLKLLFIIKFLLSALLSSCASKEIKPTNLELKLGVGMSAPDVLAVIGLPEKQVKLTETNVVFAYENIKLNFDKGLLTAGEILKPNQTSAVILKPIQELYPDYKADSIILSKRSDLVVSAFQASSYFQDESLFIKAVSSGLKLNGFTLKTNALCVALTEGFLQGTQLVLDTGYNPDLRLRNEKGIYIFPENCIEFQKQEAVAAKLRELLKLAKEDISKKNKLKTPEEQEKESAINWEEIKNFLKPTSPRPIRKGESRKD